MPRVEQVQQKALEEFRERNRKTSKRRKNKTRKQIGEFVVTFACLFFLLSLVFLQIAKKVTPNVDTSVGNNSTEVVNDKDDDNRGIDDRLKLIQFNDKMVSGELQRAGDNSIFNNDLEAPVIIPTHRKTSDVETSTPPEDGLNNDVKNIISNHQNSAAADTRPAGMPKPQAPIPQRPQINTQNSSPSLSQKDDLDRRIAAIQSSNVTINAPTNYKVLVGSYQTAEQAQLAKTILKDTEHGKNAFVKFVGGTYTLQVGSYATKEQATAVARELNTNSFPARIYYEQNANTSTKPIN